MRLIKTLFLLCLLSGAAAIAGFIYWTEQPIALTSASVEFTIKPGSGVRSATKQIQEAGIPLPPFAFEMLARVTDKANKLKAGSYELLPGK